MSGRIEDPELFQDLFAPESSEEAAAPSGNPWKVLLVDDEDDVRAVFHLALQDVLIEGRQLLLLDARSAG